MRKRNVGLFEPCLAEGCGPTEPDEQVDGRTNKVDNDYMTMHIEYSFCEMRCFYPPVLDPPRMSSACMSYLSMSGGETSLAAFPDPDACHCCDEGFRRERRREKQVHGPGRGVPWLHRRN